MATEWQRSHGLGSQVCAFTRWSRPAIPKRSTSTSANRDAQRALEECLKDEPDWRGLLRVEAIELSADFVSLN
jgi:hypothetical protein